MTFDRDAIAGDNICVIWVDDMIDIFTWRDTFGVTIRTPNIDRLFARGARFANTYATVPLCAPCRAEAATGISPYRSGLVDLSRFWRDVYPPEKSWVFDLRQAGFRTFTTGKVDSNYRPMPEDYRRLLFDIEAEARDRPTRQGIRQYLDGRGPGIFGVNAPDDDGSCDASFYDHHVAQNAIDHLRSLDPARRHFMQLGFKHPHFNLNCPDRFYQMYDPAAIVWPDIAAPEDFHGPQPGFAVYEAAYIANGNWTPEKAGDEGWRQVVRAYFAAISHVDHEIGRFLTALDASAIADRTTVVFLSDNGFNLGNHDSFHKMSQWDSAAHVPFCIASPRMTRGSRIDLPVSLHNFAMTITDLAGLPRRTDWPSGQSLLPLIDRSFGRYDKTKSPVTSVFGTLSVRPTDDTLSHLRYFRYPNGEEHVYDVVQDPGETRNLVEHDPAVPLDALRAILLQGARDLGLELSAEDLGPTAGALLAVDGTFVTAARAGGLDYWVYGEAADRLAPSPRAGEGGRRNRLWYLAGPDDHILKVPAHMDRIRVATVVARHEDGTRRNDQRVIRVVAHPDSPMEFESSERVSVEIWGSDQGDTIIGPKYGTATVHGGAGDNLLIARTKKPSDRTWFHAGPGQDTLQGSFGRDHLIGGAGDDTFRAGGRNRVVTGPGHNRVDLGEGAARVTAGPGRNAIHIGGGTHHLTLGPGAHWIEANGHPATLVVTDGAHVGLHGWSPAQIYDLSALGGVEAARLPEGGVRIEADTGSLTLWDLPGDADWQAQLGPPPEETEDEPTREEELKEFEDDES